LCINTIEIISIDEYRAKNKQFYVLCIYIYKQTIARIKEMHFNIETYRRTFSIYMRSVLIKRQYFIDKLGHIIAYTKKQKNNMLTYTLII